MEVSYVKRLKKLEKEKRKLKQIYAEMALDNRTLMVVINNSLEPKVNGNYCRAVRDADIFRPIDKVRIKTGAWSNYYNK